MAAIWIGIGTLKIVRQGQSEETSELHFKSGNYERTSNY